MLNGLFIPQMIQVSDVWLVFRAINAGQISGIIREKYAMKKIPLLIGYEASIIGDYFN